MEKSKQQPTKGGEKTGSKFELNFHVNIAEFEGEDLPDAVAYVFDSKNRLIDKKSLRSIRGEKVTFDLPTEMKNEKIKVIVGPRVEIEGPEEKKCLAEKLPNGKKPMRELSPKVILSKGGAEKSVRVREGFLGKDIVVQKDDIKKWVECTCTVRGRLVKQFILPDGTVKELGVCHACIYIWEVDAFYYIIERLPEYEILRFRDELIRIIEKWPPEPWPPIPDPSPWPPGPDPVPFLDAEIIQPFRANIPAEFKSEGGGKLKKPALKYFSNSSDFSEAQNVLRLKKMEEFDSILTAQSAVSLRREMLLKAKQLIPYLCHFSWIYQYFTKEFLTCACTDSNGYFERVITYPCSGDKPDLYFTSHQCIDCNWVTLYDPGMRCHVHWNYECGTEVRLVTTEPGAIVCVDDEIEPPPGINTWIEPHGIGGMNLSQISDEGRVDYYDGSHLVEKAPFGSTIGFRMGRSNNIPNNDVYYYRIQYRKGTTGDWHEFSAPVTRHYIHEKNNKISYPTLLLGPVANPLDDSMHLYRFKPDKPVDLDPTLDPVFDQWPEDNWFSSDIYSGYLNTTKLGSVNTAHGLHQIKFEIYDSNGTIVDPDIINPKFAFIIPTAPDSILAATPTVKVPTLPPPNENRDGKGFVFNISIDNRPCSASIDLPVVEGVVIDENSPEGFVCGFLKYEVNDDIEIIFNASQPGNNAEATFTLKRGYTKLNAMSMSRVEVASAISTGPYQNNSDGDFNQIFGVNQILGTCTNAAFAEHLYVYAKATNGWHRLSGYDAADLRAFALALDDSNNGGGS